MERELQQLPSTEPGGARRWIQSPRFDLAFFVLSPLIAIPLLVASPEPSLLSLGFACIFGVPHYLSTYVFYFWDETRAQHRAEWMLFYGGPVLIFAAIGTLVVVGVPYVIQVVVYVWNTYHVARQSCGMQSIYRHRAGVKNPEARSSANAAIIATAFALAFWNTPGHPALHTVMTRVWTGLPQAVWWSATFIAAAALVRLAWSLRARAKAGQPAGGPELAFLATSLLLFHPYLWIRSADQATLGMLLGHFIQYLAIVWLIHRRRSQTRGAGDGSPGWLRRLSLSLPLLIMVLLMSGILSLALRLAPETMIRVPYATALLAVALTHFYLDGLFWAFKRPEVRVALGPYVMGRAA